MPLFPKKLPISEETTHLLTSKQIREGAGSETKYQTETEVEGKIASEVPNSNTEQIGLDGESKAEIKSLFRQKVSPVITFEKNNKIGDRLAPIYYEEVISLPALNTSGTWISGNQCVVFSSSDVEPTVLSNTKINIKSGTYQLGFDKINILVFTFWDNEDDGIDVEIFDKVNLDPNRPFGGEVLWIKLMEAIDTDTTQLLDSSKFGNTIDIINPSQGFTVQNGSTPYQKEILLGNFDSNGGSYLRVPYNSDSLGTVSTAYTIVFDLTIPVGSYPSTYLFNNNAGVFGGSNLVLRLQDTASFRVFHNASSSSDSANYVTGAGSVFPSMATPNVSDAARRKCMFRFDGTDFEIWIDDTLRLTSSSFSGDNISTTNEWRFGGGQVEYRSKIFGVNRFFNRAISDVEYTFLRNIS
jgi:hypothetical protein